MTDTNRKNKRVLITGGSGFLARALIEYLQREWKPKSILCFSRNESKLLEVHRKYGVDIYPGDVTTFSDVFGAMQGIEQVFHLAGFKHLPLAEKESEQAITTNIIGSMNVLRASAVVVPHFVIGTSTDKACEPINCYGMTKRLMEYLFAQYERTYIGTEYRIVRYGNVLGSTGSVLEVWKEAVERGEPIKVTDPNMTRFFFTVDDAVRTIMECLETSKDATPYFPKMKAARMGDLAEAFCVYMNNIGHEYPQIETTGLRPGEKLHEDLADDAQSDKAERFTTGELRGIIEAVFK